MAIHRSLAAALVVALVAAGCASTRSGMLGVMHNTQPLVTLVVTEERRVVEQECPALLTVAPVLGCQTSRAITLPDGSAVRVVKVVRYTDALPSEMAFEIDLHELCHVVAALQPITDPCHNGNGGTVRALVGTKTSILRR